MSLANMLIAKRREKGVTQDELATHVGVSKGSVSKWENGNTFPDILLLPIIAEYFDITIDQLMNHSPKLSESESVKIYTRLAEKFATEPFEDVIDECDSLVKRHYTCFPFILYIAMLYINHAEMAEGERKTQIFQMAIDLCEHTLQNCREANLLQEAAQHQAVCYMAIGQAEKVFELLCDENKMPLQFGVGIQSALVSQAHQMIGNVDKAMEVEQIELYNALMALFNGLLSYVRLNFSDYKTARPAFERAESLAENFNMRRLNSNNSAVFYALGAHMYQAAGENEKALKTLGKYVDVCIHGFFPLVSRGDSFFDSIDKWLRKEIEATPLPRNEAVIRESMLNDVLLDPAFDNLHENPEFTNLVQKMRNFIGGQCGF